MAEAGEAVLDLVDAEEDEGDAEHDPARRLAFRAVEAEQHAEHQKRQGQRTETEVLSGQGEQPDAAGGAEVGAEEDGDAARQADQAGTDEGDGEQRDQRAGLQQHGAADAEQQALGARRGAAFEPGFQAAAGEVAQPFLQALHAEQEQPEAGAELQQAAAVPEGAGESYRGQ
ncbi:hypothetical protein D3C81_1302300 [compost metagenome]